MVLEKSLFAVHFPYLDEISNVPDLFNLEKHKGRKLKKATSPIALFVSVKSSEHKPYELKPVAIQINHKTGKIIHNYHQHHHIIHHSHHILATTQAKHLIPVLLNL